MDSNSNSDTSIRSGESLHVSQERTTMDNNSDTSIPSGESLRSRSSMHYAIVSELVITLEIRGPNDQLFPSDVFPLHPTSSGGSTGEVSSDFESEGSASTGENSFNEIPGTAQSTAQHDTSHKFGQEGKKIVEKSENLRGILECLQQENLDSLQSLLEPASKLSDELTKLKTNKLSFVEFSRYFFLVGRITDSFAFVHLPNVLARIKTAAELNLTPFEEKDFSLLKEIQNQLECLFEEVVYYTAQEVFVSTEKDLSNDTHMLSKLKKEFDGKKLLTELRDARMKLEGLMRRANVPKAVLDFSHVLGDICDENTEALSVQDNWTSEEEVSLSDRMRFINTFLDVRAVLKLAEKATQDYQFEQISCQVTTGEDSAPREDIMRALEQRLRKHRIYLRFMQSSASDRKGFLIKADVIGIPVSSTGPTIGLRTEHNSSVMELPFSYGANNRDAFRGDLLPSPAAWSIEPTIGLRTEHNSEMEYAFSDGVNDRNDFLDVQMTAAISFPDWRPFPFGPTID